MLRRPLPPTLFFIAIGIMGALHWWLPVTPLIPYPFSMLGMLPLIGGLILSILGSKRFKAAGTNIHTFEAPDILVTDHLYRYSRNPMYLGLLISLTGAAIVFGEWCGFIIALLFFIITDRWYIPYEERMMAETFKERYAALSHQNTALDMKVLSGPIG